MIRNIVFDMGNVLIRFDPSLFIEREGITDPEDRRLILDELFNSVEWAQMDRGILEEKTAEPFILERFPERLHPTVSNLLHHWAIPGDEFTGMRELVADLKNAGYGLFLLSNASTAQHRYWPLFPVSRYFDGKLVSCDVKVVKPMREIYQIFTDRFLLDPEECLFIDDAPANVAAAITCGWNGIVFHQDAAQLRRKMRQFGIRI
ncbi:HAD family phosphatase [Clostridiales bacterium]|nr:HAD family phosphatase [Clostridiales bacterium]